MDGKTLFSGVAQSGVAAIDAGTSCRKAAATFQVSVSTVIEWAECGASRSAAWSTGCQSGLQDCRSIRIRNTRESAVGHSRRFGRLPTTSGLP